MRAVEHAITVNDFVAERLTCWVPIAVAARATGVPASTLYRWIARGRLRPEQLAYEPRPVRQYEIAVRPLRRVVWLDAVRALALERKRARA